MNTQKICGVPFKGFTLVVDPLDNDTIFSVVCCSNWLKGSYKSSSIRVPENGSGVLDLDSFWNSKEMMEFRESVANGSYSFCDTKKCLRYASNDIEPPLDQAKDLIAQGIYKMDFSPSYIEVNIDRACNLSCPSCRTNYETISNPKSYNRLKSVLSSGVEKILINASGELFKNQHLLRALNEITKELYPNLKKISIITNGTLLNKTMWASLSEGFKSLIDMIQVSVDAASEQTYKKIRVGGNFHRLLETLSIIGTLKKENKIELFSIAMVLQKANIHELLDFLKLAVRVGANHVALARIENWHIQPYQKFTKDMALPDDWEIVYKDQIAAAKAFAKDNNILILSNI